MCVPCMGQCGDSAKTTLLKHAIADTVLIDVRLSPRSLYFMCNFVHTADRVFLLHVNTLYVFLYLRVYNYVHIQRT